MATVEITNDRVQVRLTRSEKVWGLHGDLDIPLTAITGARALDDGFAGVRGIRAPGVGLPRYKNGTWRSKAGSGFVLVTKDKPALELRLRDQSHSYVLVETDQAAELSNQLQAQLPTTDKN